MINHMNCSHDDTHPQSCLDYTYTLAACTAGSQNFARCADLYDSWLSGEVKDKRNLLLRAFVFNATGLAQQMTDASKQAEEGAEIDWEQLFSSCSAFFQGVGEGKMDKYLELLLGNVSGPFARQVAKLEKEGINHAIIAWATAAKVEVIKVRIDCNSTELRSALRKLLEENLLEAALEGGRSYEVTEIRKQINAAINKFVQGQEYSPTSRLHSTFETYLAIRKADMEKIRASGESIKKKIESILKRLTTQEKIDEKAIKDEVIKLDKPVTDKPTIEEGSKMAGAESDEVNAIVKEAMFPGVKRLASAGSKLFLLGATLFQWHAYQQMEDALSNTTASELAETSWRVGLMKANFASSVSSIVELLSKTAIKFVGESVLLRGLVRGAGAATIFFGAGAALVGALWDFKNAYDAGMAGHTGLAFAYGVSGFLGLGLAVCLVWGATGIGLVLGLLLVGIGILIGCLKKDKYQEWLRRGYWGNESNPYNNVGEEFHALS